MAAQRSTQVLEGKGDQGERGREQSLYDLMPAVVLGAGLGVGRGGRRW
jgi:hypothetical protein